MTVAGQAFTVSQAATAAPTSCTFSISPRSATISRSGGTGTVTVTTQAGCAWTAASNSSWIVVTAGSMGSGPGTVTYAVSANAKPRNGSMTIAGKSFQVKQR
jgi:hypothetical protein